VSVTGDETPFWFCYCHFEKWTIDLDGRYSAASRILEPEKVILTVMHPRRGFDVVNAGLERMIMNDAQFIEAVLWPLAQILYSQGVSPGGRKVWLHLDNNRVSDSEGTMTDADLPGSKRLAYPLYSLDLASSGLVLSGEAKRQRKGQSYTSVDDPELRIHSINS
jgi:hypothetical protein